MGVQDLTILTRKVDLGQGVLERAIETLETASLAARNEIIVMSMIKGDAGVTLKPGCAND